LRPRPASFSMGISKPMVRRLPKGLGKAGIKPGHYPARHLMVRPGLKARYPKRFKVATGSNHDEAISPNSLDRHKTSSPQPSLDNGYHLYLDARRLAVFGGCR
jgi:hypothetical protein